MVKAGERTVGTFRVRLLSINAQSGLWTYVGLAPTLTAVQVANRYPSGDTDHRMYAQGSGVNTINFLPDPSGIFVDGSSTPVDSSGLPPGFNITGAYLGAQAFKHGDPLVVSFHLRIGANTAADGALSLAYTPPVTMAAVLALFVGFDVAGNTPGANDFEYRGLGIEGAYDTVSSWWIIPATDGCGEKHASQLQQSGTRPPDADDGGVYELLDPDDPTAHPTPVITALTPNHGRAGASVTLKGSGFGIGATVDFDGVAATEVVVVDQFTVTCTAPPHALGDAAVVLTNTDGEAST